jgi:hypothetical protein
MLNIPMRKQNQTCLNAQKPFKTRLPMHYAQVTINGTAIENLDNFRIQSPPFNITFPDLDYIETSSSRRTQNWL